jgi:hypothetical protein
LEVIIGPCCQSVSAWHPPARNLSPWKPTTNSPQQKPPRLPSVGTGWGRYDERGLVSDEKGAGLDATCQHLSIATADLTLVRGSCSAIVYAKDLVNLCRCDD